MDEPGPATFGMMAPNYYYDSAESASHYWYTSYSQIKIKTGLNVPIKKRHPNNIGWRFFKQAQQAQQINN